MEFKLITLPYSTDALAPVISQQTIELHWGKHLQTYINNLNNLIQGTAFENADLEAIVKESDGAIFNNAGQVLNHNLFFLSLYPKKGGAPTGKLAEAIDEKWGTFENFKQAFTTAGTTLFGSGWVWLSADKKGKLEITQETNAGNPLTKKRTPILTFDVWEHSYYLDYQNRRADYLAALWSIINWDVVGERY